MPPLLSPPIDQDREAPPIAIDREWAASLVGLRMRMAASFVPGRMGEEEYIAGKIARLDVDDDICASNIFMLELDDLSGTFHHMQYDAMLCYADEQQDTSTPSTFLPPLGAIHLTRRQFVFLYEMV
jgi:hypothetical protein